MAEQLEGTGIGPVRVSKLDDHRPRACKTQDVPDQRRDREIFLPLWRGGCRREFTCLDRQQGSTGLDIVQSRCTGLGSRTPQLLELDVRRIRSLYLRQVLELVDDRIKRAIRVVQRALVSDSDV